MTFIFFCDSWTDVNVGAEACDPSGDQELWRRNSENRHQIFYAIKREHRLWRFRNSRAEFPTKNNRWVLKESPLPLHASSDFFNDVVVMEILWFTAANNPCCESNTPNQNKNLKHQN